MPRSPSYSPRRGYSPRRSRSPYARSYRREERTSLLVRNIPRDSRPEEIRIPFEKFGPIKDVYLPKDYYTGEPRGFGFVQYVDAKDAAAAQYNMDRTLINGREITVVFAEENRKQPQEMRNRDRNMRSRGFGYGRRRSPPPYSYRRSMRSRSRSPRRYSPSPPRRSRYSRSPRRSISDSPPRGRSPPPRRVSPPPRKSSPPRRSSPSPSPPDSMPKSRDRSPTY